MRVPATNIPSSPTPVSFLSAEPLDLPDSIREHQVLVGIAEWIAVRYPWRMRTTVRVRERLLEAA